MKFLLLAALTIFTTTAFSQVLGPVTPVNLTYFQIPVYKFMSAEAKVKYSPSSPNSLAKYQGQVEVTVLIEGNFCSLDPKTLGTIKNGSALNLIVGGTFQESRIGCQQASRLMSVSFPLNVEEWVGDAQVLDKSLGIISVSHPWLSSPEETDIRIHAENGELKVTTQKL
jgi:hypothetical protein